METRGVIAILGSGETGDSMVRVHRFLLDKLPAPARAVFLDTPAGFQMNADDLFDKAKDYFQRRLRQPMERAAFRSAASLSPADAEKAFQTLRRADYLFVGPGSPTYALKNWRGTPVLEIFLERIRAGGCFVAASAAALTLGRFTVPVYEIYKVGEDPFWADGLDLLGRLGLPLAVIPHWNNAEGGTHDTRFCYLGEVRLRLLESALPAGVSLLGIDEHTACILDFGAGQILVKGIGGVTLRRGPDQRVFKDGQTLTLAEFRNLLGGPSGRPPEPLPPTPLRSSASGLFEEEMENLRAECERLLREKKGAAVADTLIRLDQWIWTSGREFGDGEKIAKARELFRTLVVRLGLRFDECPKDIPALLAPIMDILLEMRGSLRRNRQWALADEIRDRLDRAGIAVEDRPEGPTWHFKI
jgi:peptidase E